MNRGFTFMVPKSRINLLSGSMHASSPRPKKARQSQSSEKSMPIVFIDYKGFVYHEYKNTT